jgi:hypothetical protein
MQASNSWLGLVGTLALAGLPGPASAQPVGSEFQVNTYTTRHQLVRSHGGHLVASDASGNFVVVWHGVGEDDNQGIFGQRYDNAGNPLGAEFLVNSYTTFAISASRPLRRRRLAPPLSASREGQRRPERPGTRQGADQGFAAIRYNRFAVARESASPISAGRE